MKQGAGRKALYSGGKMKAVVSAKVTPEQHAKYHALGGSAWLRAMLDKAKTPQQ